MKGIVVTLMAGAMLLTSCQESLEDRCAREAKEFTEKNCPRAVDKEIVLDCSDLEYISSSGLRILLGIRKETARKGGKVIIKNIREEIRQVFLMTGFYNLFEMQQA